MSDVNTQILTAKFARDILSMYREEVHAPYQQNTEPVKTRSGRLIKKPKKLNL